MKPSTWTTALLVALACAAPCSAASWVQVINQDSPGEGLNDPSPWSPIGDNDATTLGAARLKAVEFALASYANLFASDVAIVAGVKFDSLGGTSTSGVLGLGGSSTVYRDFVGAPRTATWYPSALADKLAGLDLGAGATPLDLTLTFNSDVDGAVLGPTRFYYGLNGATPEGDIELLKVAAHEIAHALGFVTLIDRQTGTKALGKDDTFLLHLEQHGVLPAELPSMTDGGRQQALTSGEALHWTGPAAVAAGSSLTGGLGPGGHLRMYSPATVTASSAVHFDVSMSPDELMEPIHVVVPVDLRLTHALLHDLGWDAPTACSQVTTP